MSFLVAGISAYRWLKNERGADVMLGLKTGVTLAAVLIPIQIFTGDMHGLNTLKYQPAKIAAIEGVWQTERGAPLLLFAWPDQVAHKNHLEIGVPKMASLILTHDVDGEIKGLNEFVDKHPPVAPLFWAFRIMVGVGSLMLMVSWLSVCQLKKTGQPKRWLAMVLLAMTFSGWVATLAGWYVTEIGRQPYLVYGVLTTAEAAAKNIGSGMLVSTLVMYLTLYVVLGAAYISTLFYMARKANTITSTPPPALSPFAASAGAAGE